MAINKKLIHFNTFENFNSRKLSANAENTQYTIGINGSIQTGSPDILYQSIVYIKDTKQQWTHSQLYNCSEGSSSDANVQAVDVGDVIDDVNVEYATKTYVDDKVANISLTDYATTAYVDGLVGNINSVLESIIGYALTFPITLTIGDNGVVGINLFNYLYNKYSAKDTISEDIYIDTTRMVTIDYKAEDYVALIGRLTLGYILYSSGVIAYASGNGADQ